MTQQANESLIEKVRKLLALSTSSNVNEAALAWQKAQQLLLEYNLTLEQLTPQEKKARQYIKEDIKLGNSRRWRKRLLAVVCNHNLCTSVSYTKSPYGAIIGERHNIEVVKFLIKTIEEQLEYLALTEYAKVYYPEVKAQEWKNNFYWGAIYVINRRLAEELQQNAEQTKALVVTVQEELDAAKQGMFTDLRKLTPIRFRSKAGLEEGKNAGYKVQLRKEIEEKANK